MISPAEVAYREWLHDVNVDEVYNPELVFMAGWLASIRWTRKMIGTEGIGRHDEEIQGGGNG